MGDFTFPRHYHLRRPSEFQSVYRGGAKKFSRGLVVYRLANDFGHPRLGLSVSRRFGGAVRRNRLKRLVREAMRQNREHWNVGGSDIVVVARKGARGYRYSDVTSELKSIFSRYGRKGP